MKIKKAQLETLIRMSQRYWSGNYRRGMKLDDELMEAECRSRMLYARKTFGEDSGYRLCCLVDAINSAKQKRVTIEDTIKIVEMLGYEVTE